jgi:nucleoside-diphosphate-sugar epimerase
MSKAAKSLRVAITGGSGRVGQWVIRALMLRGHDVINLDHRNAGSGARFVQGDIQDRQWIMPIFAECDAVCHAAEIPGPDKAEADEIFASNTRSCAIVLKAAADAGVGHAVYCSTCQVYGTWGPGWMAPARFPIDENHPMNPRNVYAVSKVANELFAQEIVRRYGEMGISVFRFPWVIFGPDQEKWMATLAASTGKLGEGMNTFIQGDDLGNAFVLAVEAGRTGYEVFNLAASEILSAIPLAERIARHHPDFPPLPKDWPSMKSPVDIQKAEKILGWRPRWTAKTILEQRPSQLLQHPVESPAGGH